MGCNWIAAEAELGGGGSSSSAAPRRISFFFNDPSKTWQGWKREKGRKSNFSSIHFSEMHITHRCIWWRWIFFHWLTAFRHTHTHSRTHFVDSSSYINMWVKPLFNFMRTCLQVETVWLWIPALPASSPLTFYYFALVTPLRHVHAADCGTPLLAWRFLRDDAHWNKGRCEVAAMWWMRHSFAGAQKAAPLTSASISWWILDVFPYF